MHDKRDSFLKNATAVARFDSGILNAAMNQASSEGTPRESDIPRTHRLTLSVCVNTPDPTARHHTTCGQVSSL